MSLKYCCCLFDFDGTISDTGEGIRKSVAYSLEKMGFPMLSESMLSRFIGPPLHDSYKEFCGMTDKQAETAIVRYRERYVDIGLYESHLYPGMAALLRALHQAGAYLAIASAKPQFMLERLAAYYKINGYLDNIVGVGLDRHSADKRDLIQRALKTGLDPRKACMVGDRRFDMEAARTLGVAALGANYGYALPGELTESGADAVFDSVNELSHYLLGEAVLSEKGQM